MKYRTKRRSITIVIAAAMAITYMVPQLSYADTSQAELKDALDSAKQQVESTKAEYEKAKAEYEAAVNSGDVATAWKNLLKQQKALIETAKKDPKVSKSLVADLEYSYKYIEDSLKEFGYNPPSLEAADKMYEEAKAALENAKENYRNAVNKASEEGGAIGKQFLDERSGLNFTIDQLANACKANPKELCKNEEKFDLALNAALTPENMIASANTIIEYNKLRQKNGLNALPTGYDLMLLSAIATASSYASQDKKSLGVSLIFERYKYGYLNDDLKKAIDGYINYNGWYDEYHSFTYELNKSAYKGIDKMTVPEIVVAYPEFIGGLSENYLDSSFKATGYAMTTTDPNIGFNPHDELVTITRRETQMFSEASTPITPENFLRELEQYCTSRNGEYQKALKEAERLKAEISNIESTTYHDAWYIDAGREGLSVQIDDLNKKLTSIQEKSPGEAVAAAISNVKVAEDSITEAEKQETDAGYVVEKKQLLDQAQTKYNDASAKLEKAEENYEPYRVDITNAEVDCSESVIYTGNAQKPLQKITNDGVTLTNGDYDVDYSNNTDIGTASMRITGRGEYKGTISKTFKIVPQKMEIKKLKAGTKRLTVKWKKSSDPITGYQIKICKTKAFKKGVKTVHVTGAKKTNKVVKKLAAKKTYYVKMRTYKKVDGVNYYSAWSKVKSIKTK